MTVDEFTSQFARMLELEDGVLRPETELASIGSWDSVAYLTAMVFVDEKLGVTLRAEMVSRAKTFEDIINAVKSVLE